MRSFMELKEKKEALLRSSGGVVMPGDQQSDFRRSYNYDD